MIPFLLPMWESEVTARAAAEQSVAVGVADMETSALMAGAEASVAGTFRDALVSVGFGVEGSYERVFQVSLSSGQLTPSDSASARASADAGYALSPLTDVSVSTRGYLATRLGVRASDALAARDPFLLGNRLQYTIAAGPDLSTALSRRARLNVSAGYEQAGALSADDAAAVGVDAQTGRARVSVGYELSDVDTLTPELRYELSHFEHALLDTELRRGAADVRSGTAFLSEAHDFSRNLTGRLGAGITVASPPPVVRSRDVVVAPAAHAALTLVAERYRLTGSYAYEYRSLGPRIGFGQEHEASVEVQLRPMAGGAHRDVLVTCHGRVSLGAAPVAADPPLHLGVGAPVAPMEGRLSSYTAVAGAEIAVPIARGIVVRGGVDLEYLRAVFDPLPRAGNTAGSLRTVFTAGIAGTLSTNQHATLRRDPDSEWDDARRDAMIREMPSGKWPPPALDSGPTPESAAPGARAADAALHSQVFEKAGHHESTADR